MSDSVEDFKAKLLSDVLAFRRELTPESDRGCALFAAAYLDRALSDLLYVFLVAGKKIEEDLFKGNTPLSSFSSRIKMAFYLGLISNDVRRDLDLIRAIRNDFAHHPVPMSFSTQSVANRCNELTNSYHAKGASPRNHFTSAVFGLLASIHSATFTRKPLEEAVGSPPSAEAKNSFRELLENASGEVHKQENGDERGR